MKKNPNLLWITAFLLGWLFDLLFWKQSIGINFLIYSLLCIAGGLLILWLAELRPAKSLLWLVPPLLFFMAIPFIRTEPMTVFLSVLFTVILGGLLAVSFLGGRWYRYSLSDYVGRFGRLLGSMLIEPAVFHAMARREEKESGKTRARVNVWPIIRGVVIAIPVVAVFAALLASADTIFGQELNDFIKVFFDVEKIPEYVFRLFYILLFGYALAGVLIHAATRSRDEKLIGEEKPILPPFLGFAESTIVLGSVIVLFSAFVIVPFQYFFGGRAYLGAGGLTESEYARRGFGELAAVAFLSLLMILGLSTITRRDNAIHRRIYSVLSVSVVALVMVMLVSAYQRLRLNELAHGFFRLRTYSHVFYVWLAILLVTVAILEILHRERAFALAAIIASIGFAASLGILNVDGFTVQQSVIRSSKGYFLNIPDNASLSTDSVPALVDAFLSPDVPASTREQVGVILACRQYADRRSGDLAPDWRSFNLSRWAADAAMKRAQSALAGYTINTEKWPMRVHTPSSQGYFECQNYYLGD